MLLWTAQAVMNVVLWGSSVSMFSSSAIRIVPPGFGRWARAEPGAASGRPPASADNPSARSTVRRLTGSSRTRRLTTSNPSWLLMALLLLPEGM